MAASRLPLVVVLGATGAGKSKLAIEIAKVFNGEIISADSMQIYKGLDIISNKVTEEEQRECPHHMISYLDASSRHNTVVDFRDKALPIIDNIFERGRVPVVVGGTNYYIESLMWDFLVKPQNQQAPGGYQANSNTGVGSNPQRDRTPSPDSAESKKQRFETEETAIKSSRLITRPEELENIPANPNSSNQPNTVSQAPSICQGVSVDDQKGSQNIPEDKSVDSPPGCLPGKVTSDVSESETLLWLNKLATSDLFDQLVKVDPDTALRHHPNNRRKLLRALQVFYESGSTLSSILTEQHGGQSGTQLKSGPLRYPDPCILWVKCQQPTLNERLDGRVDTMIERGLVQELEDFDVEARQLNQDDQEGRTESSDPSTVQEFPHGIMQMIGFKEFKDFLMLSPEDRLTDHGQKLFQRGVNDLKLVTRRYARQQVRWINNRFCSRPGPDVPPVYAVDTTDLTKWPQSLQQALDVVTAYTKGEKPAQSSEPTIDRDNFRYERHVCDVCDGRVFLHQHEWQGHIRSKKHRHNVKLHNKRTELSSILDSREKHLKAVQENRDDGENIDSNSDSDDDDDNVSDNKNSIDSRGKDPPMD